MAQDVADDDQATARRPQKRPPASTAVQFAALATLAVLAVIDARSPDFMVDRDWLVALVAIVFGVEITHQWPRD